MCKCSEDKSPNSRNLVVCIDGTSNRFGNKNTNIVELYSHIKKDDSQLTYYSSGLGAIAKVTGGSLRHRFSSDLDMIFGRNLHKVIMASYRWLSDNYQNGDRIFLFGFSRGAYQVRALAGMIARVGLLLPGNNEQIPFAFDLYSKTDDDDSSLTGPVSVASVISHPVAKECKKKAEYAVLAKTFQRTFCRSYVHIHFVGVWDTVSSVGVGRSKTLPCTTTSCDHICYFRHALALDERRVKFLPEYVYGGRSSCSDDGRIKEVWFAGSHSDVGGGNRQNEKLHSGDIPLLWMRSQAIAAGLEMEPADVMWKIDDLNKPITPSLTPAWWPLEIMPLRRLLYYNSDRHTSSPHLGEPRRILPGQKVHVSVLFKNNYKPRAQFYNNPVGWPEPMFWNDVTSHQRLQDLPDSWEKDIFDDRLVQTLLDDLTRGQSVLHALDRLAFLTGFDVYKNAISDYQDVEQILATSLNSRDRLVRLSTAVIYCELEWDLPSETTRGELLAPKITEDVTELLKVPEHCRRACMWMPSLCKRPDLKVALISETNLRTLVKFCDNTRIARHEEGTSTVAFHSAQALSMLMKLDDKFGGRLIKMQLVSDLIEALRSNCSPVLVAVLNVLDGVAREDVVTMKSGLIIATILKLVKEFDDFVAPAATRVLCSLLPDEELRSMMLRFGVLPTFLDMLDRCSVDTKQVTCHALDKFMQYSDVRDLLKDSYLAKLAKQAQCCARTKRNGAILALVTLGETPVRAAMMEAMEAAETIPLLIGQLNQKSTALSAAEALALLVKIDDVAEPVSAEKSGAASAIVNMLQNRWFDGLRGEDGLQVLRELLECERFRSAVLNTGIIDVLCQMIGSERYESVYAGLHYLRVIARFDESSLPTRGMQSLVLPIVNALRAPQRRVQRIAMKALRFLSREESLRATIIEGLLDLLRNRHAGAIHTASTVLGLLATDEAVRDRIVEDDAFLNLSHDYYDGNLGRDLKSKGPRTSEVYESVGHLIKLAQVHESDGTDAAITEDQRIDTRWFAPVPYEPKKDSRSGAYRIARPFMLSRTGRTESYI